jgi:hypothetical protein
MSAYLDAPRDDAPITHANPAELHQDGESGSAYAGAFCVHYRRHHDAIVLLRQLHALAKAVQRHRGMVMALLAGNLAFAEEFALLQLEVARRLATLEAFAQVSGDLLSERDQGNLHNAWQTICADWQQDAVIDNFELHSHFIEQLHGMIGALAKSIERPVSWLVAPAMAEALAHHAPQQTFKQHELLNFITKQLPDMVEQMARMRGLSTYAAARGTCEYFLDRKLRFALQCVRAQHEKVRQQAERLHGLLEARLTSLSFIKTYELKLMFLVNTIERDVLAGGDITSSAHQLFKLATEIIDVYLKVVEEGFEWIAKWQDEDMESWLMQA